MTNSLIAHWTSVVRLVEEFVRLFQEDTIDTRMFADIIQMAETAYRFSQKEAMIARVHSLAIALVRPYTREDLLLAPWLYLRHDLSEFRRFLNGHIHPNKARVTLYTYCEADWQLVGLPADIKWAVAPYYGTKYFVGQMPTPVGACPELDRLMLPRSNPFIPKDLSVLPYVPQVSKIFYYLQLLTTLWPWRIYRQRKTRWPSYSCHEAFCGIKKITITLFLGGTYTAIYEGARLICGCRKYKCSWSCIKFDI